jgi:hypothetical protein
VLLRECTATLLGCDVSSATGAGVGIEGGAPTLDACRLHGCARQGAAIFGGLEEPVSDTLGDAEGSAAAPAAGALLRGCASHQSINLDAHSHQHCRVRLPRCG